jgi:hypothetical protein
MHLTDASHFRYFVIATERKKERKRERKKERKKGKTVRRQHN